MIAERFVKTRPFLLKKPIFENGNSYWISELPTVGKNYNITIHQSSKSTSIDRSKKVSEKTVYFNLQGKRRKT